MCPTVLASQGILRTVMNMCYVVQAHTGIISNNGYYFVKFICVDVTECLNFKEKCSVENVLNDFPCSPCVPGVLIASC